MTRRRNQTEFNTSLLNKTYFKIPLHCKEHNDILKNKIRQVRERGILRGGGGLGREKKL